MNAMRVDKNRRKNVPADARSDERKAGTRNARREDKLQIAADAERGEKPEDDE